MNNFLEENQKADIRYESDNGKIVLYEPNEDERNILKAIIAENIKRSKDGTISGTVSVKYIREIFRMLVKDGNFIDKYTDDELLDKLNKGNRKIKLLYREIEDLIFEISEEVIFDSINQVKFIDQLLNILKSNEDLEKVQKKLSKLLKKQGIDIKAEDLLGRGESLDVLTNAVLEFNNKK